MRPQTAGSRPSPQQAGVLMALPQTEDLLPARPANGVLPATLNRPDTYNALRSR